MIVLITGASHTGKTVLAQKILEKYHFPYFSIDHLKMGLIRSGYTNLTPEDDDKLQTYLWPIVREMIKTCIENSQNQIVEGCYIPFGWEKDFSLEDLRQIKYICLIFSKKYIETHLDDILRFEKVIEKRLSSDVILDEIIKTNEYNLEQCVLRHYNHILIDDTYQIDIECI